MRVSPKFHLLALSFAATDCTSGTPAANSDAALIGADTAAAVADTVADLPFGMKPAPKGGGYCCPQTGGSCNGGSPGGWVEVPDLSHCPHDDPADYYAGSRAYDQHGCPILVGGGTICCMCWDSNNSDVSKTPNADWFAEMSSRIFDLCVKAAGCCAGGMEGHTEKCWSAWMPNGKDFSTSTFAALAGNALLQEPKLMALCADSAKSLESSCNLADFFAAMQRCKFPYADIAAVDEPCHSTPTSPPIYCAHGDGQCLPLGSGGTAKCVALAANGDSCGANVACGPGSVCLSQETTPTCAKVGTTCNVALDALPCLGKTKCASGVCLPDDATIAGGACSSDGQCASFSTCAQGQCRPKVCGLF